jgi:hypothetical protein
LTRRPAAKHSDIVKVFLSYASEDREWARKLASLLERKGLDVWDATSALSRGDNWSLETGKALEKAEAMVVLVSPAATESENLKRELEYALVTKKFRNRLIPVIISPTRELPWILNQLDPEKGTPSEVSERILKRLETGEAAAHRTYREADILCGPSAQRS